MTDVEITSPRLQANAFHSRRLQASIHEEDKEAASSIYSFIFQYKIIT
jgi:hypothetical protein